jgi:UDP-N-acetylmuramoylalanine--D-glutamate ligase
LDLAGKNALVVGLAKSGVAAAALLLAHGARVRATDSRPEAGDAVKHLGVEFRAQSPEVFEGVDPIVISPGVPTDIEPLQAARARGVEVIGEIELAAPFLQGEIIGITGSNGKTTTTALTGHILRESGVSVQVGGNIGTPVAAMVESSAPGKWNVLELSSFQLETIREFRARIGVALNVTPDHLDRHHTLANYAAAKGRLFETQRAGDFAVLNADDEACRAYAAGTPAAVKWFSLKGAVDPGAWLDQGRLMLFGERLIDAVELPLRGLHNVENTLAAALACALAGVPREAIAAAIRTFRAVEHRLEFVARVAGVDFYNDSKATNVDATLKALDAFPGGLWVILGGKDKGSDYRTLIDPLARKARAVLLIGAAATIIREHLGGAVPLIEAGTLEEAVRTGFASARPGDTVLLAPACASFDQFQNYEHRGETFKSLVRSLEETHGCCA